MAYLQIISFYFNKISNISLQFLSNNPPVQFVQADLTYSRLKRGDHNDQYITPQKRFWINRKGEIQI